MYDCSRAFFYAAFSLSHLPHSPEEGGQTLSTASHNMKPTNSGLLNYGAL